MRGRESAGAQRSERDGVRSHNRKARRARHAPVLQKLLRFVQRGVLAAAANIERFVGVFVVVRVFPHIFEFEFRVITELFFNLVFQEHEIVHDQESVGDRVLRAARVLILACDLVRARAHVSV